ncbi:MAG: hypothetical protein WAM14_09050, partial [Candidatus Nitrosopolaris sp.]
TSYFLFNQPCAESAHLITDHQTSSCYVGWYAGKRYIPGAYCYCAYKTVNIMVYQNIRGGMPHN